MAPEKDSETFLMKDIHARKRQRMQNNATNRIAHWLEFKNNCVSIAQSKNFFDYGVVVRS